MMTTILFQDSIDPGRFPIRLTLLGQCKVGLNLVSALVTSCCDLKTELLEIYIGCVG